MPIVAIAFHETLAREKMRQFFASAVVAGAKAAVTNCPTCSQGYALIFLNRADAKNEEYRHDLLQLIKRDCMSGTHRDEYALITDSTLEN